MIVTRIPPSPTGHLHFGTARTALFNWLLARQCGGKVLLRSEDTDQSRSKREYEDEIIRDLKWLGIECDNSDTIVRQSERGELYRQYLEQLIVVDKAYLSREASKTEPEREVEVVRLRNPGQVITFNDLIRGDITFDTTELGDIVIARNLDDALYHFTVVVDDYTMGITHVLRGEDHISNTPRQILIQEALGFPRPLYGHIPLILAPDRSKMSKRHGTVAVAEFREQGYLKEALLNYITLLGWNPGTDRELFSLSDLVESFSLHQVQKGGAVFDIKKLNWFNRQYLDQLDQAAFADYLDISTAILPSHLTFNSERYERLLPTLKERTETRAQCLAEFAAGEYDFAFSAPTYETELLQWKNDSDYKAALPRLEQARALLAKADFSSPDTIKAALWSYAEAVGKGELLWPLRIALSGRKQSPDPFTIAYIIGREETIARIESACGKIDE